MIKKFIPLAIVSSLFVGCASVPMEDKEASGKAKEFAPPAQGQAGLYIFRENSAAGGALKKDVWVNGKCVGETAPGIFFYEEVPGGKDVSISTESEFSANSLLLKTESGKHYFIQQSIKMGVFVGGAKLEQVSDELGKKEVQELDLATKGSCSK